MRIYAFLVICFFSIDSFGYVPPVESLFRHGPNPDVTANGVMLTFKVKKTGSKTPDVQEQLEDDYYRLFFTKVSNEIMKVAQARYNNSNFSDSSLIERKYFTNLTPQSFRGGEEDAEKGIFHALLRSILFNDGAYIVGYLKSLGVPVKLNNEIINRQKVEYLAGYKQYLLAINKDKNNKKSMPNPLKPDDPAQREKIESVMNSPMYIDQEQVKIKREWKTRLAYICISI